METPTPVLACTYPSRRRRLPVQLSLYHTVALGSCPQGPAGCKEGREAVP